MQSDFPRLYGCTLLWSGSIFPPQCSGITDRADRHIDNSYNLGILLMRHVCRPTRPSLRWMTCIVWDMSAHCFGDRAIPPLMDSARFCVAIEPERKPEPAEEQFRKECDISKYQLLFEWPNNMCFDAHRSAPSIYPAFNTSGLIHRHTSVLFHQCGLSGISGRPAWVSFQWNENVWN